MRSAMGGWNRRGVPEPADRAPQQQIGSYSVMGRPVGRRRPGRVEAMNVSGRRSGRRYRDHVGRAGDDADERADPQPCHREQREDRKAASASGALPWIRQPTIRPLMTITAIARTRRQLRCQMAEQEGERCIGSERKRSRMPSPRSVAIEVVALIPNVSDLHEDAPDQVSRLRPGRAITPPKTNRAFPQRLAYAARTVIPHFFVENNSTS